MRLCTTATLVLVSTTALLGSSAVVAQTSSKTISIAEARTLSLGKTVTIEGSITVPSGAFKSSFDDEGFAIQDGSSGIYVSVHVNLNLLVGDRVRVTGKLAETNAQFKIIEADQNSTKVIGRGRPLRPRNISTRDANAQTLGQLVKVTATISNPVVSIAPFGFRLSIHDGTGEVVVFVSTSTKISEQNLPQGKRISVAGIVGQFKGQYQIYPRFPADVRLMR